MRNQKTQAVARTLDGYPAGELRRRVADCRQRLRRNRPARRIAERATLHVEEPPAEVPAPGQASADGTEAEEET